MALLEFPTTFLGILIYLIGLVVLWVIISIPVYFAGKAVTKGKSGMGTAMGATLGGGIVYFIVYAIVSLFLGAVIGDTARAFALLLGILAWLAVYRAAFDTSWPKAIAIVVLAWIIFIILDFVLYSAFGVGFPKFFLF